MATGQQLQVIRAQMAPGTDFGLHVHDQEQFIIVLEGCLEFTVGEETRLARRGTVIHAPPGVRHGGRVYGAETVITLEAFTPPRTNFTGAHDTMDFDRPE
jgi:quercetin dioxygenase-like cupin family protein